MLRKQTDRTTGQTDPSEADADPEGLRRQTGARVGPNLKSRAVRLLAGREHSRAELHRKLLPHADSEDALQLVLDDLVAKDLISDQRVVSSVMNQRARQRGVVSIRQTLLAKGVSEADFEPALAELAGTEGDRAWEVWCRRYAQRDPSNDADKAQTGTQRQQALQRETARQMRFLIGRGFAPSIASATLRRARREAAGTGTKSELRDESDDSTP